MNIPLVLTIVLLNSIGQVMLKLAAQKIGLSRFSFMSGGYALFIVSMILVKYYLGSYSLVSITIVLSANILGVMLLSCFFLKEKMTGKHILGSVLIMFGAVVFCW